MNYYAAMRLLGQHDYVSFYTLKATDRVAAEDELEGLLRESRLSTKEGEAPWINNDHHCRIDFAFVFCDTDAVPVEAWKAKWLKLYREANKTYTEQQERQELERLKAKYEGT
jgi:hypothetical protein